MQVCQVNILDNVRDYSYIYHQDMTQVYQGRLPKDDVLFLSLRSNPQIQKFLQFPKDQPKHLPHTHH